MIIDANEIVSGTEVRCDLCIIGAGAAGITIAREFDGTDVNVWLLESGGFDFEQTTQDLYKGSSSGRAYTPLDSTRLRYFGGTTNHWNGMCRPLDEIDFTYRDWIPHSGWPFDREYLDPWYRRAQSICELDKFSYEADEWLPENQGASPFAGGNIRTRVNQQSTPTRFGKAYRDQIKSSRNITLVLHANITHIQADSTPSQVKHLNVKTQDGNQFTIKPSLIILACGSIENTRLLLASNDVEVQGLGNQHDLVGRCFMDHLVLLWGGALVTTKSRVPGFWYKPRRAGRFNLPMPVLLLNDEIQQSEGVGNYSVMLHPEVHPRGVVSFRYLENQFQHDRNIDDLWKHIGNVVGDLDDVGSMLYNRNTSPDLKPYKLGLYQQWEQTPNLDSRVTLTSERDELGLPRVHLDWQLSEIDRHTLFAGQNALAREMGRLGVGRLRIDIDSREAMPEEVFYDNHQLGTTRMSDNPRQGVVDRDCRLHTVKNLYIAGGSVFPTSGSSNPTLTVVALSLRLADHLKEKFA